MRFVNILFEVSSPLSYRLNLVHWMRVGIYARACMYVWFVYTHTTYNVRNAESHWNWKHGLPSKKYSLWCSRNHYGHETNPSTSRVTVHGISDVHFLCKRDSLSSPLITFLSLLFVFTTRHILISPLIPLLLVSFKQRYNHTCGSVILKILISLCVIFRLIARR